MNRSPRQLSRNNSSRWLKVIPIVVLILGGVSLFLKDQDDPLENLEYINGHLLNPKLLSLADNRWVKIYPQTTNILQSFSFENLFGSGLSWYRQGHAGLAFDSKAKSLLTFGSDSHGENWDNRVHEFSLLSLKWKEHYSSSAKETYRADQNGNAIAGEGALFPWAMHTYDNIAYIPEMDALVVTSQIDHTPAPTEQARKAQFNPTWIYFLNTQEWKILEQKNTPSFFATGSTYDPISSSLWAYKQGSLWQFDIALQQWRKISGPHNTDLSMHFMMTTDTKRHQLVFFGNYNNSNSIWVYTPGLLPEQQGKWENKQPGGDLCPKDQHFPVAYDKQQGVFLLVPDENKEKSVTLVYSPDENEYIRIMGADMPANGMNYMMEYDPYHRLFLLVTGDWKSPVTVWAFRLNMQTLNRGH